MEDYSEEQQSQEQQEPFYSYPYQTPTTVGLSNPNLIKFMLSSRDIVKHIEKTLLGWKLNDKDKWERDKDMKPLEKEAINIIVRVLRSHLPRNQTLANLEYNDVMRMARLIRVNIIDAIYENWELFTYEGEEINEPNLSLCDEVVNLIDHNIFSNLTRAKNGTENKLLRTVYRSHDMQQVAERSLETQNRGGMFGGLFKRKRFFTPTGLNEQNVGRIING
jgi:hypothetical protein